MFRLGCTSFTRKGLLLKQLPVRVLSSFVTVQVDSATETAAIPFEKIPGPKPLPIIGIAHHFFPGGKHHNLGLKGVHFKLRNEYGDVVHLPGSFGKKGIVFLFNPKDIETMFRNDGQWPYRRGMEVLNDFRTNERPDLFQGLAGVLQE